MNGTRRARGKLLARGFEKTANACGAGSWENRLYGVMSKRRRAVVGNKLIISRFGNRSEQYMNRMKLVLLLAENLVYDFEEIPEFTNTMQVII